MTMAAVAAPSAGAGSRIDDVRQIAVLRPNAVGDFIFALPALAALRAAYPQAHITLLGRRWHREFLTGRPGPVDEVIELPAVPGVGAPADQVADPSAVARFLDEMQARRLDVAIQLYGGGAHSNPFVARLGARVTAGLRAPDAAALDRWIPYRPWQNERLRLLEVAGLLGAKPVDLAPALAVTEADEAALREHVRLPEGPVVVLQPGATDARRRWPAERFAAVGNALAREGAHVVVNGGPDEQPLVRQVMAGLQTSALPVSGVLSLSALAALLRRARLLVSNDTGPLHLAQAVGTPTIGIYWFMNLLASAPLVAAHHPAAFSTRLHCPVCGVENVQQRCPHDASFVADVSLDEVLGLALAQFRGA